MFKCLQLLFLIFLIGFCIPTSGQTLEARYKVFKPLNATSGNGMLNNIATLEWDGFLYQQNNRFIYFKKPLYLDKYPGGYVDIATDENNITAIGIVMDTVQAIRYLDFDSLIYRSSINISGSPGHGINHKGNLSTNNINWRFLPDTKEINGLKCQKAQFINGNGKLQWVVWFCPDIPALGGPGYITGLPGIVVDGENKITSETYVLVSYRSNIKLPDNIFWPKEFNAPFK